MKISSSGKRKSEQQTGAQDPATKKKIKAGNETSKQRISSGEPAPVLTQRPRPFSFCSTEPNLEDTTENKAETRFRDGYWQWDAELVNPTNSSNIGARKAASRSSDTKLSSRTKETPSPVAATKIGNCE
jgi:hypothetical protein